MKPRVLYLIWEYNTSNGWGTCAVNWIEGLRNDVEYAEIASVNNGVNDETPWPVHPILRSATNGRFKGLAIAWDAWRVRRLCRGRFDIIHSLVEPFVPLGDQLAREYSSKSMIQFIGTYCVSPVKTKWAICYEKAYQRSGSIIAISHHTRKRALEEFPNLDVEVAHIGVDESRFTTDETRVPSEPYFLFVGASKPRKGLLTALRGFKEFLNECGGYRFHVVGRFDDGFSYNQKVISFVNQNKLPVDFLGPVTHQELVLQFQRCTAHVLPSESAPFVFEGFGLVHLEANICGSLTIGSKDSANEEVIEDGISGFLVPKKDPEAVCVAMAKASRMMRKDSFTSSENCRKHARKFDWEDSISAIRKAYNKCM